MSNMLSNTVIIIIIAIIITILGVIVALKTYKTKENTEDTQNWSPGKHKIRFTNKPEKSIIPDKLDENYFGVGGKRKKKRFIKSKIRERKPLKK